MDYQTTYVSIFQILKKKKKIYISKLNKICNFNEVKKVYFRVNLGLQGAPKLTRA